MFNRDWSSDVCSSDLGSSTQPLLHFGTRRDPNPGITFNFTNVNLKGYSNNYVFSCAQFGQSFWRRSFNGIAWIVADSIGAGLDTQFPAKVWPTNQPYGSFSDSPATAFVSNDTQTWRGNNLSMQLLFRPTGPSIPIALKRIDWDWLGHAVYTNAWELEISPTNAAHITATNAPVASTPAWTNNILIHRTDYNTNSLPPFK